MALVLLSKQDDYDLVHGDQDCRGWPVRDTQGNPLGRCLDMVIDTGAERVNSIVLEDGRQIAAADIALRDGTVLVRAAAGGDVGGATREAGGRAATTDNATGEMVVPIIEEHIAVGKRQVERGGVRVSQRVSETPIEETVNLREERVHVERRPADRLVDVANMEAFREGTLEVTETAEEAVVAKQARVVEEVVVGKDVEQRQQTVRDTVRHTEVEIEKINADKKRG